MRSPVKFPAVAASAPPLKVATVKPPPPDLHIALFDRFQRPLAHDQHNDLGLLKSGLETEGRRTERKERRFAPTITGSGKQHAAAAFGTEDKAALDEGRNNENRPRPS
jgi:hypothetical protein